MGTPCSGGNGGDSAGFLEEVEGPSEEIAFIFYDAISIREVQRLTWHGFEAAKSSPFCLRVLAFFLACLDFICDIEKAILLRSWIYLLERLSISAILWIIEVED